MSETLGSLVDKLIIDNLKLWHAQEDVYRYQRMTLEEYEQVPAAETHKAWQRLAALNLSRNGHMVELDELLAEAVHTGTARVDARVKIT